MPYSLGKRSLRNLVGVHPDIGRAVHLAIGYTTQDFGIPNDGGLRSIAQVSAIVKRGTGIANSLHLPQADGFAHAVDLVAWENMKYTWGKNHEDKLRLYLPIRAAMLRACDEVGIPIQHGADWDLDGILEEPGEWDWPHFQFPNLPHRKAAAFEAMQLRLENLRNGR